MHANEQDTKLVTMTEEEVRNARMTPEQSARFASIRDEDIVYDEDSPDTSDWPEDTWTRPDAIKPPTAVHLDSDVVRHFQELGEDYEKRMSDALRAHIESHRDTPAA